jgi:hypothetical protein
MTAFPKPFFLGVLLSCSISLGQDGAIGVFSDGGDVGAVKIAGSAKYDPKSQSYELAGAGSNMWFAEDQFQFVWKKLSGDFVLRTRAELVGEGVDAHRKFGWMIRSSLDTDSAYVDVAVHGDGLTSMQFRRTKGADTEQVQSPIRAPGVIQLSRKAGTYTMSVARFGDTFASEQLKNVGLGDEVYVGLFVCSHNAEVVEQATFRNVRVIIPAPSDFRPYRDYIGSRLETMHIETGHRTLVHSVEDSLQAPNWTTDNKSLIFNRNGLLYRFELESAEVTQIPTGFANRNNNDHVLSFDGKSLAISHHTADDRGQSHVYTMPVSGGTPRKVTQQGPCYLHGWSPDGQHLLYTAERNGDYDVYRVPAAGGAEERLTDSSGLDDGSEYAPDGSKIYFNSVRSGRMQIWRMNADGSAQEQLTDDEYNNWFPHIAPDGKSLVMLSFDKNVDSDDHPFYEHIYLRRMSVEGGAPSVVAYVYGGQGTINVPSWSPDSKSIAFVSNSGKVN